MLRIIRVIQNCLKIGRPYYVLPVIAAAVAGFCWGSNVHPFCSTGGQVGLVFFLLGMTCWAVNEIADRSSDANGETKTRWGFYVSGGTCILSSGTVSVGLSLFYVATLATSALFLASFLGVAFWLLCFSFLAIGLAYSLKPARLKERGTFGLAAIAIACGFVAFTAGWVAGGKIPTIECLFFASMLSITFFGFDGLGHLLDHEQDQSNNETTFSVSLGRKKARIVLAVCQCLPALVLTLESQIKRSAVPDINNFMMIPLLLVSCLFAAMTVIFKQESVISSLRVASVPLLAVFAFLII